MSLVISISEPAFFLLSFLIKATSNLSGENASKRLGAFWI
jgi:hypothetical protein